MPEAQATPTIQRSETCTIQTARRVAAMLDLDPDGLRDGDPLPLGWHFVLLAADTPRTQLRGDGFPGLGVPIPDLGFERLMLGRRRIEFHQDIPIGGVLQRQSSIRSLTRKDSASGPMAFVDVEHALASDPMAPPSLVEVATYILLPGNGPKGGRGSADDTSPSQARRRKRLIPDDTMLFQYSALGFNSHKIHLDRSYARDVEGYSDLVVNGGLTALLLTEFARTDLGLRPQSIDVRYTAPLFCSRPITLTATNDGSLWRLRALDEEGRVAAEMQMEAP